MARLLIKSSAFGEQVITLKLGVNRFGRAPQCDFRLDHVTVSAVHCEVVLSADGVTVRDCDSTNGTFINDEPVANAALETGQTLRLGEVEIMVESTEVTVSIPKFEMPRPAPPVVRTDGSMICPRHDGAKVTHRCTYCKEVMCDDCVHRLRRRGGKMLKLCPLCSHACEVIGGEKPRKKTFFGLLQQTVKLPFVRGAKDRD
jgi:hypothetical protein